MAVIEIEMVSATFGQYVQALASIGPIPVGIVNGLGPTRLIAKFKWGQVDVGHSPPGFNPPPGVLTARCAVTLTHISIAELDANPHAAGANSEITAWVSITLSPVNVQIHLLAVQVPNTPVESYSPRILVAWMNIPSIAQASFVSAAFVLLGEVVTFRFGTRSSDYLLSSPANLVSNIGDEWAVHIPGDYFAEKLLDALNQALAKPPDGTTVEDAPSTSWEFHNDAWVAVGSVGLEKKDVCPVIGGCVDISVTVDVVLTPSATIVPPSPTLNLTLELHSNASDWDSFRCWLGNGAIASVVLGYVAPLVVDPPKGEAAVLLGAFLSLIAVAETVRLQAGDQLNEQTFNNFTLTSSTSTSATYSGSLPLPSLVQSTSGGIANGTISPVEVGSFGMLISGNIVAYGADHQIKFVPDGSTLTSKLKNKYDCGRKTWFRKAEVQAIEISDTAIPLGQPPVINQVKVFPSSTASPASLWSVDIPPPDIAQYVTISSSKSVKSGDTGRVYLHTSAGLRRFDIAPLPQIAAPTPNQEIAAVIACLNNAKIFTAREKILWLPDPAPFLIRFDPLRQWQFTFARVPAGTQFILHQVGHDVQTGRPLFFTFERSGAASFELITDGSTEIRITHNQDSIHEGRVIQRWITPTQVIPMGAPGRKLLRSGLLLAIEQGAGIFTFDLSTGLASRQLGELTLSKLPSGRFEVLERTRRLLGKAVSEQSPHIQKTGELAQTAANTTSFSLTLPGGKIAALFEDKLVIGIPSEQVVYGP